MSYPTMKYACGKCKDVITSQGPLSRCPRCGTFVTLIEEVVIFVRDYSQTYIARAAFGKTASCTAGRKQAAERLAVKIFGTRPFTLEKFTEYSYIATGEIMKGMGEG